MPELPEPARAHLRAALALLVPYRTMIEAPTPTYQYPVESRTLRAIEARLYRALDAIDQRNL